MLEVFNEIGEVDVVFVLCGGGGLLLGLLLVICVL